MDDSLERVRTGASLHRSLARFFPTRSWKKRDKNKTSESKANTGATPICYHQPDFQMQRTGKKLSLSSDSLVLLTVGGRFSASVHCISITWIQGSGGGYLVEAG
ncbi:uncharacterized protein LOC112346186 [Selaginella moellendorffii]|uniref:uncharacterized protein LOC112346186 n=1 Tax=Selaginella moellendorffii TaxID=88036 RepID=UPI000D1CC3CB|nr:uncharacterized protein LOC112346186 [Selaginella moellendorffii]|eukprot:XP_024530269.1 uncharacterized protein LOC112346186 [Selaginella moellendorffii]